MARLIIARVLQAILALLVVTLVVFLITRATGSPADLLLGQNATPADYAALERRLGLDRSIIVQYIVFLRDLMTGDLGDSARSGVPVRELIFDRLPATLLLAACSIVILLVVGIPLGVLAAVKRGSLVDTATTGLSVLLQSLPAFWIGIIFIQVFAVRLGWFPSSGNSTPSSVVLPAVTFAFFGIGGTARLVRTSMLEVLNSEFVTFARATGKSERRVVTRHALRNSLLPVVTYLGLLVSILLTLNAVVESVFNWPGIGRLTFDAIVFRDFPLIQGVVLLAAALVIVINLALDILYVYLDPRIRYGS